RARINNGGARRDQRFIMSGWPSDLFGWRQTSLGWDLPKRFEGPENLERGGKDPPFGDGGDGDGGDGGGEKCLEYKLTRLPLIHSDPFYLENSSRKGCSISWKTKVLLYLSAHPK
ncbi:hypothetical protein V1478_016975, partial [Vespula squamosa]